MKKVIIRIAKGKISADFEGFRGQECQRLESAIRIEGLAVEDTVEKPELHLHTDADTNFETS